MDVFLQDFRYAARLLIRSRGFTVVAVITLGLGMGACTAVFSVVNSVILEPLPFPEPDRLVRLFAAHASPDRRSDRIDISFPDFIDWRWQNTHFVDMGIYTHRVCNFTGGERPERLLMLCASARVLPTLGLSVKIGRRFGPHEDQLGRERVVLLSDGLWQRQFGGERSVLGESIILDGVPFTVIGVLPAELEKVCGRFDVWSPFPFDPGLFGRGRRALNGLGRLKRGVTPAQAQTELEATAVRLADAYPDTNRGYGVRVVPITEVVVGDTAGPALAVLSAAVAFVLLIACANIANLLLARATVREQECTVRSVLGATKGRLVRQMLTESVVLAIVGGTLGVLLAVWGRDFLVAALTDTVGRVEEIATDGRVLAFAVLVSLVTAVLFGFAPALACVGRDLGTALRPIGRSASAGKRGGVRRDLLIVSEVAMALALVTCAGLMLRSFLALRAVDPGFDTGDLLTMRLNLPEDRYAEEEKRTAFFEQVVRRIRTAPSVESAAAVCSIPLIGRNQTSAATIEDYISPDFPNEGPAVGDTVVTPAYFETLGMPVLKGRGFTEHDTSEGPGVVIINEHMARQFWPDGNAIGRRLKFDFRNSDTPWLTIIGVVGNAKHVALNRDTRLETYRPYAQVPWHHMTVVVRTYGDPMQAAPWVQSTIWEIDPDLALYQVRSMGDIVSDNTRGLSAVAGLLTLFATIALALAAVGLYGVMSYVVSRRTQEIGIRVALGAQGRDILRLVIGRSLILTSLGIGCGIVLAFFVAYGARALLYGISPADPTTLIGVTLLLSAVAVVACYIPARRATKVDPMVALRYE